MIRDVAILAAIELYFAKGGEIHRYPSGVSGRQIVDHDFRRFAYSRWVRRYGHELLPREALHCLELGIITVTEARTPIVWTTVRLLGIELATCNAVAASMRTGETSARRSLEMLEYRNYVFRDRRHGRDFFGVLGERAPHWREFISPLQVVAATRMPAYAKPAPAEPEARRA